MSSISELSRLQESNNELSLLLSYAEESKQDMENEFTFKLSASEKISNDAIEIARQDIQTMQYLNHLHSRARDEKRELALELSSAQFDLSRAEGDKTAVEDELGNLQSAYSDLYSRSEMTYKAYDRRIESMEKELAELREGKERYLKELDNFYGLF
jgi:chromosome segregation ATPase